MIIVGGSREEKEESLGARKENSSRIVKGMKSREREKNMRNETRVI